MLSAVAGGVTSIFKYLILTLLQLYETIEDKLSRAAKGAWSDYARLFGWHNENLT